jgi:hypothetical protein
MAQSPHQRLSTKLAQTTSEQHDLKMAGRNRGPYSSSKTMDKRLGNHGSRARTAVVNLSQMSYDGNTIDRGSQQNLETDAYQSARGPHFELDTKGLSQPMGSSNRVQSAAAGLINRNYNEKTGYESQGIGGANINREAYLQFGSLKDEHKRPMILLDCH